MVTTHNEAGVTYTWQNPRRSGQESSDPFVAVAFESRAYGQHIREEFRGVWQDRTVWILCTRRNNSEELAQRLFAHWSRYNGPRETWEYRLNVGHPFVI